MFLVWLTIGHVVKIKRKPLPVYTPKHFMMEIPNCPVFLLWKPRPMHPIPVSKLICAQVRADPAGVKPSSLYLHQFAQSWCFPSPFLNFFIFLHKKPVVRQEALFSNGSQNMPNQTFSSCKTLVDFIFKCGVIALWIANTNLSFFFFSPLNNKGNG